MSGNLFYGIELAIPVQDRLSSFIDSIKSSAPRTTWTTPDKLHLTLHFIGKAGDDEEEDAAMALGTVDHEPFDIHVIGVGQFDAGRVLWAGVKLLDDSATFTPFDMIRNRLGAKGRFNAHVTLAKFEHSNQRSNDFLDYSRTLRDYDFGVSRVTSVKLYKTIGKDKPYEVLAWKNLE